MLETISPSLTETLPSHQAIGELQLSADLALRAAQLAANTTGEGILRAITSLHNALAPEVPHEPSDVARSINNPQTGKETAKLLQPEERMPLFETAANLIRTLGQTVQPGEEQNYLNRSASVLALSVVLTHTFEDGNGRTARTLAHAVREGSEVTDQNKDDFNTVSRNRPESGFKITSYVPTRDGVGLTPVELITAAASLDVPLSDKANYQLRVDNNFTLPYAEAS